MTDPHPNVLFLTVDALRPDRTSLHGYKRPTTPTLERLGEEAIVCEENISPTAFTQPALPAMLTSSMPLSFGGYDRGVWNRPPSLFKVFADAGYETTLISTFPWVSRFYGYGDGVRREQMQFVINALVGIAGQTVVSSLAAYHDGTLSEQAMMGDVAPVVEKLFRDLDAYCDLRLEQAPLDARDMAYQRLLSDGYDYRRIKRVIDRHRLDFLADKAAYVKRQLPRAPKAHEWIAHDWRYARRPGALIANGLDRLAARILMPVAPSQARMLEYRRKRYVDARALADRVIHMIETRDLDRPFFIWSHFFDTHVPYCPGSAPGWHRWSPDYLAAVGHAADTDPAVAVASKPRTEDEWVAWSALYDATVRYVDEQIGRIIDALHDHGLAEDTLVVITSDHGEELGEHGDISHHFRLYEHNIRVPLLFHRPGMEARRIDGLTTLLDLAPTMADLAGVTPAEGWTGAPVTSPDVARRPHVVAEAFHGGNCLFDHRPPYVAVRTRRYKYLWKEYRDPTDRFSPEGLELYEYRDDPLEQHNVYCTDHPALPALNQVVVDRLMEIPEISKARISAAFGTAADDALKRAGERIVSD